MITLNIKSITDEIFALTALRSAICSGDTPPESLCRDNLPALRVLVRSAFARLTHRLLPYISTTTLADGNPEADRPYDPAAEVTLTIGLSDRAARLSSGATMILKRYLEHLTALMVLRQIYLPLDAEIAGSHAEEITDLLDKVRAFLSASTPLIVPAYL